MSVVEVIKFNCYKYLLILIESKLKAFIYLTVEVKIDNYQVKTDNIAL